MENKGRPRETGGKSGQTNGDLLRLGESKETRGGERESGASKVDLMGPGKRLKRLDETSGDHWRPVETNGDQWRPMEINGDQWRPMETNGHRLRLGESKETRGEEGIRGGYRRLDETRTA